MKKSDRLLIDKEFLLSIYRLAIYAWKLQRENHRDRKGLSLYKNEVDCSIDESLAFICSDIEMFFTANDKKLLEELANICDDVDTKIKKETKEFLWAKKESE